MPRPLLLLAFASAAFGCGGARPPLAGLATGAVIGNLGEHDAPFASEGFFGGPVPAPSEPALAGCAGYFTGSPDVVLRPAGAALRVSADAEQRVAILVRDARGEWHCAVGAAVELSAEATAGQMRIWVGAPSAETAAEALLRVERR